MAVADAPWLFVYGPPYNHDPLDWAEGQVAFLFMLHREIPSARQARPGAWPTFGPDTSDEAFAHRVLGALLDYGWQPPATTTTDKEHNAMTLTPHRPPLRVIESTGNHRDAASADPAVPWKGTPCGGCQHLTADGEEITRYSGTWWHLSCAQADLATAPAAQGWLTLAHQLARSPGSFRVGETRAIVGALIGLVASPPESYDDQDDDYLPPVFRAAAVIAHHGGSYRDDRHRAATIASLVMAGSGDAGWLDAAAVVQRAINDPAVISPRERSAIQDAAVALGIEPADPEGA